MTGHLFPLLCFGFSVPAMMPPRFVCLGVMGVAPKVAGLVASRFTS
jgi:hypothetical protein